MKKKIVLLLSLSVIFVTGCATTYQGNGPNLDATGSATVGEFHQFKMKEPGRRGFSVVMGKDNIDYSVRSLLPLVEKVSPDGDLHFETANRWRRSQEIALLISVVSFAAYLFNTQNSGLGYLAGGSALASIGLSFSWGGSLREGIQLYNKDLETKLRTKYNSTSP